MKNRIFPVLLFLTFLLWGCGGTPGSPPASTVPETTTPVQTTAAPEATTPTQTQPEPMEAYVPQAHASGEQQTQCSDAVVDHSHTEEGYVMVLYSGQTDKRLKVLLTGPTATYRYDLPQGQWTVLPLSDGSGSYRLGIYRNTAGTKYATVMSAAFEVSLHDEFAPFLRPNRYVDYSSATKAVAIGQEVTRDLTDPLEKVAAVYDYVTSTLSYDFEKAESVKSGYLPELDTVLEAEKGICFDYAALMTAMLRSQKIPCKLVVGYAGSTYHAWISVWTEEQGWIDGILFFDGHSWKRMDPTFADSGETEALEFITSGTYTEKYLY